MKKKIKMKIKMTMTMKMCDSGMKTGVASDMIKGDKPQNEN